MRLKQLKLSGFKSFANPTTFHFPKTITAIVGPNGCGKSNVIDAIRWVLGESSAKQLRGGAMSDVIFAGTQDKPAKSLASVELVFEQTQGDAQGKGIIHHPLNLYHELSVRRQINKEGKSEYFINGTKVRRRDVVDIFLGTGLGARSYAVIEQGMIGRIIEANPLQLREFIEEASGVSRYQSRREDTQKQLTTAQDNLARLQDMVSELRLQRSRLENQAKTAKLAQTWQRSLADISQQLLLDDYGQAWQKSNRLAQDYQAISQQVTAQNTQLQALLQQQHLVQQHIAEQQLAHQAQQTLAQRHWQQHHEAQSLLNQSEQKLGNDQQRLNTLNFERNRFEDYIQDLTQQRQQAQVKIATIPQQLDSLNQQLNDLRDEQHNLKHQRQTVANTLVVLNQQKTEYEKVLAVSESGLRHLDNQRERLAKRQVEHEQAVQAWQATKAKFDSEFADIDDDDSKSQLVKLSDSIARMEAQIIARQEQLADQADEVDSLTRQLRQAEAQYQTWQTEQSTLQNLIEQQQQMLTRTVNATPNQLPTLVSQLSLTQQGTEYASIFDCLISVFRQWVITDNQTLAQIVNEVGVLFAHNSPVNLSISSDNLSKRERLADEFINLAELIAEPKLPIFEQIWLNRDPNLFSLDDNANKALVSQLAPNHWLLWQNQAQQLVLVNQYFLFNLTQLLQADRQADDAPAFSFSQQFTQQARIDELQALLDKQQPQVARLTQALQEANISLQEWQAQARSARNELASLTQQKQQRHNANIQREHRYQTGFDQLTANKQRLDMEAKRLHEEASALNATLDHDHESLAQVQQALDKLQPQLGQSMSERQALDDRLQILANQQRELEQQNSRLTQSLATGQLQISASEQQLAKAEQDKVRLHSEYTQLIQSITEQTARLPQLQAQVDEQAVSLAQANQGVTELANQLAQLEQDYQHHQQQAQQAQNEVATLQQHQHTTDTALALAQQNLQRISEQLQERQLDIPNIEALSLLSKATRHDLNSQIGKLKAKLNDLGAVNHAAVEELTEVNSRLEPLAAQISDLSASIDKLQQAIKQIDSQTKSLFLGMLTEVNIELNRLFVQVFGGGKAELILTDATTDNRGSDWQSGLELMAQPKGKKNSRLALLSGGEKTLTALSLVFAIFKQQPAPFCVLDEVDAPLDDANVERFTRLIEQLALDVQFIFISHNKLAMQIADELKGVTMPSAGISKLVSVDMADVVNYLEQAAT